MVGAAAAMIVAHLAFRAWVIYGAFFYSDDYVLLDEARRGSPDLDYLLTPYDAQFMPVGRLLAWVGARPEAISWPLLATMSLLLAAAAALSCLWMLVSLFGWRPGVLLVLALYLSSAMTLPAFLWWAAALNQLPLQSVFFLAVGAWVRYLRGDGRRWLLLTCLVLVLGLLCYVKTLLLFPVLAFLALAYFASGGPLSRVGTILRRHWAVSLGAVVGGAAFLGVYLTTTPQISDDGQPLGAGALAEQMIATSFATAVVGGPWQWDEWVSPAAIASPPAVLIHLTWVVLALTVAYLWLRRERTGRAWLLLLGYVLADYALLLTTRGQSVGAISGAELRYLTDALCAFVLALGLATMEVRGAVETSRERSMPLLTRPVGRLPIAVLTALVVGSGLWSSTTYARVWHERHPGEVFFTTTVDYLKYDDRVDLANQGLASEVTGAISADRSNTSLILPLLSPAARFPEITHDLHVLADDGAVVPAEIDVAVETEGAPSGACGWLVDADGPQELELDGRVVDYGWWLRIDYLASNDSGLRISAGDTTTVANLRRGAHQLFVHTEGEFDSVRLDGVDDGVTLCVSRVVVGKPEPGSPEQEDQQ